jgi:hypothetical protein
MTLTRHLQTVLRKCAKAALSRRAHCRQHHSFAPNLAASMIGIPPADEQAAVIEQIKAMMISPDPVERAQAQRRRPGIIALNFGKRG